MIGDGHGSLATRHDAGRCRLPCNGDTAFVTDFPPAQHSRELSHRWLTRCSRLHAVPAKDATSGGSEHGQLAHERLRDHIDILRDVICAGRRRHRQSYLRRKDHGNCDSRHTSYPYVIRNDQEWEENLAPRLGSIWKQQLECYSVPRAAHPVYSTYYSSVHRVQLHSNLNKQERGSVSSGCADFARPDA